MAKYVAAATIFSLAMVIGFTQADEPKLDGVKCVVANKRAAKDSKFVEYRGAKVFFCCDNCPKAFAKNTKKFAAAANNQLVATGQAEQVKCPFSGGKLNPETKITVNGAAVCFCCEMCQGKAAAAKGAAQVNLIFNNKAFDKGFKVKSAN